MSREEPGTGRRERLLEHARAASGSPRLLSLGLYGEVAALLESEPDTGVRAAVFLAAMESAEDPRAATLFANLLLCCGDPGRDRLLEAYRAAERPEDLRRRPRVLSALCRTGDSFLRAILADLEEGRRLPLALKGLAAAARCLDPPWLAEACVERLRNEIRVREMWPPLPRRDLDGALLANLEDRAAVLAAHDDPEVGDRAIEALGRLGTARHAGVVRDALGSLSEATRIRAVRAAAALGDLDALPMLGELARSERPAERRAVAEALGRLEGESTEPLLLELLADPDRAVVRAAVGAAGPEPGGAVREALRGLSRSPDKTLRKAALRALAARPDGGWPRDWPRIARERLLALEPDARPFTFVSLGAALRFALTEDRPWGVRELTRRIAVVCADYSSVRRYLVEEGVLSREDDVYELTQAGRTAWRVEHGILDTYLKSWGAAGNP
jgi:hypothetical protein